MKKFEGLSTLQSGDKITIVAHSDFGSLYQLHGKVVSIDIREWAQYKEAVMIKIIPKGKRKPRTYVYHENKECAVYLGYIETDYKPATYKKGDLTVSEWNAWDKEKFQTAIQSTNEKPVFLNSRT